ncbi:SLBB domain-containing protein [Pseudemcibacter aquimaris]|uniref:SLBB domain-containing protein n=1 Tax=Pseudemcibacter aquimaris TaxID=2857064 RepID=UPI002011CD43|nr:SLBB domain-containing protein [Pseudemcibacter aquimaris]MCC3859698.1 SLBB domain-containing protein [Pseudemcibacter aquimaris]WDU60093.1 SLBB domain-containing protein [Pseudemcibacter aquimaris]
MSNILAYGRNIALILIGYLLLLSNVFAQSLDQNIFDQIRQQTGASNQTTRIQSPLDQLRAQDYMDKLNQQLMERRAQGPSVIEQGYNARQTNLGGENATVSQFGYNIFDRLPMPDEMITGAVPDSYVIGVGDQFVISFKGSKEEVVQTQVDREGRLIIPTLQPLLAANMTFGALKDEIKKQVSESLIGTEVYLSLATLRQISVLVVGEVYNPSIVRTTSLSSPIEVLLHVGGVKKTGSLRNITLQRGDERIPIDLYDILDGINPSIINLKDGDRIIVPTIGSTVAIGGNVIRPAIYELPDGKKIISSSEALDLAGGPIRPKGNAYTHIRYNDSGRQLYEKMDLNGNISNGEMVIVNLFDNSEEGRVTLLGHVKTPGIRSVSEYSNVKDLLGSVKNLGENPHLLFGVIIRTDQVTNTRQFLSFNVHGVLYNQENVDLVDEDKVIIFGRNEIEFLSSDIVRSVIYNNEYDQFEFLQDGAVNNYYCKPVDRLARLIASSKSNRFATATRAVYVGSEGVSNGLGVDNNSLSRTDVLNNMELESLQDRRIETISGISDFTNADIIRNAELEAQMEEDRRFRVNNFCPAIYVDEENLLPFVLEHIISVEGAIRLPGVLPISPDTRVDLVMSTVGGPSNDADLSKIEISRLSIDEVDNSRRLDWDYVDASINDLSTVKLNPGGGMRVSSLYTNFEDGAVLLTGEVMEPGVYTIRKGEKLSSLIRRAGGLTAQAYPYGAIFTRERVKNMQRAEMKQTADRLQSAMVSAFVKKNIDANGVVAVQRMVAEMAEQDFLGRVVIEADPVILSLDPVKDIVLEAGDSLYMPKRPNFIVTVGDVLNPSALQFIPGKGLESYLQEVGGFTQSADEDRVFVVYPNGVSKPISLASWGGDRNLSLPPGSAIVVPTDLSPYDGITLISEIGDIFRNLAVSAASIAVLVRN